MGPLDPIFFAIDALSGVEAGVIHVRWLRLTFLSALVVFAPIVAGLVAIRVGRLSKWIAVGLAGGGSAGFLYLWLWEYTPVFELWFFFFPVAHLILCLALVASQAVTASRSWRRTMLAGVIMAVLSVYGFAAVFLASLTSQPTTVGWRQPEERIQPKRILGRRAVGLTRRCSGPPPRGC